MNVLLTSATGYIGSAVAEALQAAGHRVTGLARSDEVAQRLQSRHIHVLRGDLHSPETIAAAARQVDGVIHTAATKDASMPQTDRMASTAILEALDNTGKPFIYTSGTWLLGNTGEKIADEQSPLDPIPLMAWRAEIETLVLAARERNVRTIVMRPAIVYGRGGGLVATLVQSGRQHSVVQFVGTGENRWVLVHVEDLARCYVAALEQAPSGTLLIAANPQALPLGEIAEAASRAAGVPGRTQSWSVEEARKVMGPLVDGLVLDQQVSSTKAMKLLDWKPKAPSLLEELEYGSYMTDLTLPHVEGVGFLKIRNS